jgi:hypothetical protein
MPRPCEHGIFADADTKAIKAEHDVAGSEADCRIISKKQGMTNMPYFTKAMSCTPWKQHPKGRPTLNKKDHKNHEKSP